MRGRGRKAPRRHKMTRRGSRKSFRKASGAHKRNSRGSPMRGGIRM